MTRERSCTPWKRSLRVASGCGRPTYLLLDIMTTYLTFCIIKIKDKIKSTKYLVTLNILRRRIHRRTLIPMGGNPVGTVIAISRRLLMTTYNKNTEINFKLLYPESCIWFNYKKTTINVWEFFLIFEAWIIVH